MFIETCGGVGIGVRYLVLIGMCGLLGPYDHPTSYWKLSKLQPSSQDLAKTISGGSKFEELACSLI